MLSILMRALAFIAIIFLGYGLKCRGFFKDEDLNLISKMVVRITLPCAVATNCSRMDMDKSLLGLILLGVLLNFIMLGTGYIMNMKNAKEEKAFDMINFSGYNIGCFTIPYVQSFIGPFGVLSASMFDMGNALLCTGGTSALAQGVLKRGTGSGIKDFFKKLFSSTTVDVYLLMLLLGLWNLRLPEGILNFTEIVGGANSFLAMLMIGIGFEVHFPKDKVNHIIKALFTRYTIAGIFALFFYFALPLPYELRLALVFIAFSPVSSVCVAFTKECDGDVAMSSAINSLSIITSLILMTVIMVAI